MLNIFLKPIPRLTTAFLFPLLKDSNVYDRNKLEENPSLKPKTSVERVKAIFEINEYNDISPDLKICVQASTTAFFLGGCYGGIIRSRVAYINFVENNQATIFTTTLEAKKKLQDKVMLAFAKGAYQWGWRLAIFTGMFYLISMMTEAYFGEVTLLQYSLAGAITGALYKINLGLIAALVGAGLGLVLSSIAGVCVLILLKVSGFNMGDVKAVLLRISEARKRQLDEAYEKASNEKHDYLTEHHDQIVKSRGEVKLDKL